MVANANVGAVSVAPVSEDGGSFRATLKAMGRRKQIKVMFKDNVLA